MKSIKKEKTILFGQTMMVLAMCVCGFTACGDDADEQPTLPTFQEVSAKYVATDEKAAFQIVELTPDAHFIMTAPANEEVGDIRYGNYSILAQNQFRLNGYGTLEVKDLSADSYSLTLTPTNGAAINVPTSKRKAVEGGTLTDRMVGSWKVTAQQIRLERDGIVFSKTIKEGEWEALDQELRTWAKQFEGEVDKTWLKYRLDDMVEEYKHPFPSVVFTRFGTYLVMSEEGSECAWWQWQDERQGLLRYSWTEGNLYDEDESGLSRIGFSDGLLTIAQDFPGFFSETVTAYCESIK